MYLIRGASFWAYRIPSASSGPDAIDLIKMPLGLDLAVGASHGVGHGGRGRRHASLLAVPLWRSYLAGCILLGIAPCTAMVLVWGYLARGNDGH